MAARVAPEADGRLSEGGKLGDGFARVKGGGIRVGLMVDGGRGRVFIILLLFLEIWMKDAPRLLMYSRFIWLR